jgi:Family of unknown function (DUF5715)
MQNIYSHFRGFLVSRRFNLVLFSICLSLLATQSFAINATMRTRRVRKVSRHVRRVAWNPMFRGSHEMLVRENVQIDELQLPRIMNDEELERLEATEELVPVSSTQALGVAGNLLPTRRYCRPWTRDFLQDFSEAFYGEFRRPIEVTSLVRTAEQQKKLRRHNGNAAPEEGDTASTHLTGMTVDILKRGLTRKQHDWVNQYFLPLKARGAIDPIEERRQPVFHVTVFNTYNDKYPVQTVPAFLEPVVNSGAQEIPAVLVGTETSSTPQLGAQD